jgi:hypothetical protein
MDVNPHWRPLLELTFDATAELAVLRDAQLPLALLEVLQRGAVQRRKWRPPPACSLMMRNTWRYLLVSEYAFVAASKASIQG